MQHKLRTNIGRKSIICVDSYEEGVLQGRLYNPFREMETFSGLSQLLLKTEQILDLQQMPQSYTETRVFSEMPLTVHHAGRMMPARRGTRATFELQILFRQHTSWQGILYWMEKNVQQQFRSVLELVFLLDSALSRQEEKAYSGDSSGE